MADTVVIVEGSHTPAMGYLKRGQQAEVTMSENVRDLANKGYIIIRGDSNTPPAVPVTPEVPQGTNQDLLEATPVQAPDQTVPEVEVPNPDVDNSLVDVTDPGTDAPVEAPTTRTATTKSTKR